MMIRQRYIVINTFKAMLSLSPARPLDFLCLCFVIFVFFFAFSFLQFLKEKRFYRLLGMLDAALRDK